MNLATAKIFLYEKVMSSTWNSDKPKKKSQKQKTSKKRALPDFVKITLELWQPDYSDTQTFEFILPLIVEKQGVANKKAVASDQAKQQGKNAPS